MSTGISRGASPWWQQPPNANKLQNLTDSAPSGYEYDPVQGGYVSQVGSPTDQLVQRKRTQGMEDSSFGLSTASKQQDLAEKGTMYNALNGAMTGLSGSPTVPMSGVGGGASPMASPAPVSYGGPALDAARAATFARTKDTAANTARSALNGLTEELQARGMGGAGYEAGQVGGTLAREADQIGEGTRMQAEQELQGQQHAADESYQGGVAQRGQDIGAQEANANRDAQSKLALANLSQQKQISLASMISRALGGLQAAF